MENATRPKEERPDRVPIDANNPVYRQGAMAFDRAIVRGGDAHRIVGDCPYDQGDARRTYWWVGWLDAREAVWEAERKKKA